MGAALPNHAYVDLNLVNDTGGEGIRCYTDLTTCCSSTQGIHRGDWYFPDQSKLLSTGDIYQHRRNKHVEIKRRNDALSPSGIYRCDIPTNNVHNITDASVTDSIYVGLYGTGGNCECIQLQGLEQISML